MFKKGVAFLVLFVFMGMLMGCETVKGAGRDLEKAWQAVLKADAWVKKHAW